MNLYWSMNEWEWGMESSYRRMPTNKCRRVENRKIIIWQTSQWWLMKTVDVSEWVGVYWRTGYWHSLIVFFHKILISYKEGNGDFMVKTGRHKLVQVIKINTISHGMIWHPVSPEMMHQEEHSIIFWGLLARNTWLESGHEETSYGPKLRVTHITQENKTIWLFKIVKGERDRERVKNCSRLKKIYGCYVRECPCLGKYILEYTEVKQLCVHNLLSNGLEKYWRLKNSLFRWRENRFIFVLSL